MSERPRPLAPDTLTLVMIAFAVYVLSTVVHEGVGHGGACMLVGGAPVAMSSVHFECDDTRVGEAGKRIVAAGGTIANLAAGFLLLGALRVRQASGQWHYALWLGMTVNLLQGAGYFLFSGVANIGDWAEIIRGLSPWWAWRAGLAVAGAALYVAFVLLALREMGPLIGGGEDRVTRARKLTVTAYLAGGILSCVAGMLNPVGMVLVAISAAAASFGGTSGLAWMAEWLQGPRIAPWPEPPLALDRRWRLIVTGALLAVLYVAVLGPGVRFR
jgi:hypothetical protein